MIESLLLPTVTVLCLNDVKFEEQRSIVWASMTNTTALCPACQEPSHRIHSHYQRKIADLPWAGYPVVLMLQVRRLLCRNTGCKKQVFCERLTPAIAAYARRTAGN